MRSKRSRRPAGPADRDAIITAEGVSKRYPGRPMMMFPPVVSIFDRGILKRANSAQLPSRRRRADTEPAGEPFHDLADLEDPDLDDDDDDEDDLDDDYAEELERLTSRLPPRRAGPGETFWALRDVSMTVSRGQAIGVVGERGAGKSTLLRILGGRAFPTEGRVVLRGTVGPLAGELPAAIAAAGKGEINLPQACRLLGVEARVTREHEAEILELAQPLTTSEGDTVPGAIPRLAVAAAVVLPSDAILFDEPQGMDDAFMERIESRLRGRLESGCALVVASRRPRGLVERLCGETILLREGEVSDPSAAEAPALEEEADGHQAGRRRGPAFNALAALMSVEVAPGSGAGPKRVDGAEELLVHVEVETATPAVQLSCAVSFMPRDGGASVHVELPQPVHLDRAGRHRLTARIPPGTLPGSAYLTRAEAMVEAADASAAGPIARDGPRFRIGDAGREPADPLPKRLSKHRGSDDSQLVDAVWSIE